VAINSTPVVILGSNGFVGSKVTQLLEKNSLHVLKPSSRELDILNYPSLLAFFNKHKSQVVINFAAYTDVEEAEKQRGNKNSISWKLNVKGPKNLAKLCSKYNTFLIHISTDSVFYDFKKYPRGFEESTVPKAYLTRLTWYGYTKLLGEKQLAKSKIKLAIVRISYPFGNLKSKKDFILKTIHYIKTNVPFFKDFYFTPTFIPDLAETIEKIAKFKKSGIYHITSPNITTPYKIALYIAKKLNLKNTIKSQSLNDYIKNKIVPKRPKYSNLNNIRTRKLLNVKFHNWQKAIDELYA